MNLLAEHIGHRLTLKDERHLRCLDCTRTLVLPASTSALTSTSTSKSTPPRPDERCSVHLGWADACTGCAADRKATDDGLPRDTQPTADVTTGIAQARAALAAATARRRPTPTSPETAP